MVGVITSWDVFAHPISTIRCFGWSVFFKALAPWHQKTFLSLLHDAGCFDAAASKVPTILERCIVLEQRAKRIYEILATTFSDQADVSQFFAGLAMQEQFHADFLNVCRAASLRTGWNVKLFNPWQNFLPRIEEQMEDTEEAVYQIDILDIALQLVIQIESSEINEVFYAALAATDEAFVKHFKPFREAMKTHMTYIAVRIPQLSPQLMIACRGLRAKFPRVRN
jgi:rubrerythrin